MQRAVSELLTFGMQVTHYLTHARQAAHVECAMLLIDQATGANLDDLQDCHCVM